MTRHDYSEQDFQSLAAKFRRLGHPDPEGTARSQLCENIDHLTPYRFMRMAWRIVVDENDPAWINGQIRDAAQNRGQSFAGIGEALARLLGIGASIDDITDLVRGMQVQFMHDLLFEMTFPSTRDGGEGERAWGVVELSTDGDEPPTTAALDGLHELVLMYDPTGREMRPRLR